MGKPKFSRVVTSDDEDDHLPLSLGKTEKQKNERRKPRKVYLDDCDDEEDKDQVKDENPREKRIRSEREEEEEGTEAKKLVDENPYKLEDTVLIQPEEKDQKPYVAIIKDITKHKSDGTIMLQVQWLYRPEEVEKKGGGHLESTDARELFYSFQRDEVHVETVMHKCIVHFIPPNKQIPKRKKHPGFFVQKVYDPFQKELFNINDKDYDDSKQKEIHILVQKTVSKLGNLPDATNFVLDERRSLKKKVANFFLESC